MKNIEEAYEALALYLIEFIDNRAWDSASCVFKVFAKMATAQHEFLKDGVAEKKGGFSKDVNAMWGGLDAALFVRDDMLKSTGKRLWAFTFSIFPDGKFNIEYDYNKPEDYEETDELMSGDEINESLNKIAP